MTQTIAIIGAGISGLAAGCYGQMNGFSTQLFEQHDKPGGLCTSWQKEGYTFDGCLEWLVGTAEGSTFNRIWKELGALQGRAIVQHEEVNRYQNAAGQCAILYRNPQRLAAHLKALAPADHTRIDALIQAVEHFRSFAPFGLEKHSVSAFLHEFGKVFEMARAAVELIRYRDTSVQDWASDFKTPFLKEALSAQFQLPDFPFIAMVAMLAWHANDDAGYPVGGSLAFARSIEERYRNLGGNIKYGSRVHRIVVESGRAVGVELEDGSIHRADVVISAGDGRTTIFKLLEGRYLDHDLRIRYDTLPRFPALVRVSLGVNRDLRTAPHSLTFTPTHPIMVDGALVPVITARHYAYDPNLAPEGRTVMCVSIPSNFEAWRTLRQYPEIYAREKHRIAEEVVTALQGPFPGLSKQVEVVDIATPVTFERYTGNWNGSFEGWALTTRTLKAQMSKQLPGLERFFMIGQWTSPGGGLPPAAMSGRNVIRQICKAEGREFRATMPNM